ncbi:protein kinase domain-containing protein [Gordonia spumicola]|uniref:serine/threonine-protein kinase n=1 Tax=Gordonia spumicola TaxID=589161 RepID=UPI001E50DAEE|nr:protein kinase [Gordonia spumicola]
MLSQLGAGGMGEVYRVEHLELRRIEALKRISGAGTTDPDFHKRFRSEARTTAALDHPSIIGVNNYGIADDGSPWIAMPLLHGDDLKGRIFTPRVLAPIATQIGAALDYAHSHGVVHRDIKPANLFLTIDAESGKPTDAMILDFGIAKAADATKLTATNTLIGTLAYTAPEVIEGRPASPASDQYALACTIHELLTGVSPFSGTSASQIMAAHLDKPAPPLSQTDPRLAPADPVMARALAKDPARRYPSCGAFIGELNSSLGRPGYRPAPAVVSPTFVSPAFSTPTQIAPAAVSPWQKNRTTILAAAAAVVAVLVVISAVVVLGGGDENHDGGLLAGQLTSEFPTAPDVAWKFSPSDVGASTLQRMGSGFVALRPPFAYDDTAIITIADEHLVGTTLATGDRWTSTQTVDTCADRIVDGLVGCLSGSQLVLINTIDGSTRTSAPAYPGLVGSNAAGHFVLPDDSATGSGEMQLTKFTPDGVEWAKSYTPDALGSSLQGRGTVLTSDTAVFFGTAPALFVDAASGDSLVQGLIDPDSARVTPAGTFVVGTKQGDVQSTVAVYPNGSIRDVPHGSTSTWSTATPEVADEKYGNVLWVGDKPVGLDEPVPGWPSAVSAFSDGSSGPIDIPLATTDYTILAGGDIVAVNTATGSELWRHPSAKGGLSYGGRAVTDGRHIIFFDSSTLIAADLATGEVAWTLPLTDLIGSSSSTGGALSLLAAGDMLIVASETGGIAALSPSGGAATTPGTR